MLVDLPDEFVQHIRKLAKKTFFDIVKILWRLIMPEVMWTMPGIVACKMAKSNQHKSLPRIFLKNEKAPIV